MPRRRLYLAGLVMVLAFMAVELHYARGAARMCHPPRVHVTEADARAVRETLPGVEEVSFSSADGLLLRGYYVPSRNGATVVMGHGLGDNRMYFLPDVEMLARHGYGALFFDWRAHGESEGDSSTWSDREQGELRAAVDFVSRRPDVVEGRIAALGFSIGASTVAMEAASDPRVRAVIVEALFTSFDEELRDKMGRRGILSLWPALATVRYYGIDADRIRPIDHVAEIAPRPILFIAGSRDADTPVPVVERAFAAASEPKKLWIVEGAGHGEYEKVAPVECERVIASFLDASFFGGAGGAGGSGSGETPSPKVLE